MYKIIGADQKEYGPISAEQIRSWISEGRVNAQTKACLEGTEDWKPLGMFPEFGFTTSPLVGNLPAAETGPVSMEDLVARDYTLDILGCINRAWETFKSDFAAVFVPFLLWVGLLIATMLAGWIIFAAVGINRVPAGSRPYLVSPTSLIIKSLILGPATGGLYYIYLCLIRRRPANAGDLFLGFKSGFQDLFLGMLISAFFVDGCMLPYNLIYAKKIAPLLESVQQNPQSVPPLEMFHQWMSAFTSSLPALLLCMIPSLYFTVTFLFTLPLIIDKQMGFWTAIKTSWKITHKHWFHLFGLVVAMAIINILGGMACCVGLLVAVPLNSLILLYAYEDIFGRKTA